MRPTRSCQWTTTCLPKTARSSASGWPAALREGPLGPVTSRSSANSATIRRRFPTDPIPPTEKPEFALACAFTTRANTTRRTKLGNRFGLTSRMTNGVSSSEDLIEVISAFHNSSGNVLRASPARLLARGLEKLDKYPPDDLGVALGILSRGRAAVHRHHVGSRRKRSRDRSSQSGARAQAWPNLILVRSSWM